MVHSWHQTGMPTFRQLARLIVVNASAPLTTQQIARHSGGSKAETLDGLRDLQAWGIVIGVRRGSGDLCWEPRVTSRRLRRLMRSLRGRTGTSRIDRVGAGNHGARPTLSRHAELGLLL